MVFRKFVIVRSSKLEKSTSFYCSGRMTGRAVCREKTSLNKWN